MNVLYARIAAVEPLSLSLKATTTLGTKFIVPKDCPGVMDVSEGACVAVYFEGGLFLEPRATYIPVVAKVATPSSGRNIYDLLTACAG